MKKDNWDKIIDVMMDEGYDKIDELHLEINKHLYSLTKRTKN